MKLYLQAGGVRSGMVPIHFQLSPNGQDTKTIDLMVKPSECSAQDRLVSVWSENPLSSGLL